MKKIIVREAEEPDSKYANEIAAEVESSARARGTGISRRSPESIQQKIRAGQAVIAVTDDGEWVGYSYIEVWAKGDFVSNSGLIVAPEFRGQGVASRIKKKIVELSWKRYPKAKIFSITTGLAIMKLNSEMGFRPVTYSEIPQDELFWSKCGSCVNYDILQGKNRKNCLCTAFLLERHQPQHVFNPETDEH